MSQTKNAIITGGTKGIGRAIIELLLDKGYNISTCSRTESDLKDLVDTLQPDYSNQIIHTKAVDMGQKDEVIRYAEEILSKWKTVDVLVNNAGVFLPGEIASEEDGKLEKQIEVNLYSAYHFTRGILPVMINAKSGHIINMCSIASKIAYPNGGSYSISKFALLGFNKVLREELKEKGIKVTAILPGATWSNSWSGVDLPHERLMEAKDIAQATWNAIVLGPSAVVEEIVVRPQLGDL